MIRGTSYTDTVCWTERANQLQLLWQQQDACKVQSLFLFVSALTQDDSRESIG